MQPAALEARHGRLRRAGGVIARRGPICIGPRVAVSRGIQGAENGQAGRSELGARGERLIGRATRPLQLGVDRPPAAGVRVNRVVGGACDSVRGLAQHAEALRRPMLSGKLAVEVGSQVVDQRAGALHDR